MSDNERCAQRWPRVLIVRLSAIGDTLHTMPVACALRERFPQAWLCWVVESRAAAVLRGHKALDRVVELPRGWLKQPTLVWRLRHELRAMRFDAAVDVQGLSKSALVAWLSGAPKRIGFDGPRGRELSRWLNNHLVPTRGPHVIDHNLQLLSALGIGQAQVRFDVPEHAPDRRRAEAIVGATGLEAGYAIINPGASWPSKLWPAARYAAVARHLHARWQLPSLVVWAGKQEEQLAAAVVVQAQPAAVLAPATTLGELAALARRCRLFLSADSGPLHLAVAVGAPCVGLYGPWPAETNGPYGPLSIAIQAVHFEGSTRARRRAPAELMEAITVEMVAAACDEILRREGRRAA